MWGGIRNDLEGVHKLFQLPDLVAPLFLLCLGYPAHKPGLKPRLPRGLVHKVDSYHQDQDSDLLAAYDREVREYYTERTGGKIRDKWTERCGQALSVKQRDGAGYYLREIGFLEK